MVIIVSTKTYIDTVTLIILVITYFKLSVLCKALGLNLVMISDYIYMQMTDGYG